MTVTVSVDATWRLARVEFQAPETPHGMAYGYGEVLLQAPSTPSEGSSILQSRSPMMPSPKEGEKVTYGTMPGATIVRGIQEVKADTVKPDGDTEISFEQVLKALGMFFEKWRKEDEEKPPIQMTAPPPPPPMPPLEPPPQAQPQEAEEAT